jgi:hypothetical protein
MHSSTKKTAKKNLQKKNPQNFKGNTGRKEMCNTDVIMEKQTLWSIDKVRALRSSGDGTSGSVSPEVGI